MMPCMPGRAKCVSRGFVVSPVLRRRRSRQLPRARELTDEVIGFDGGTAQRALARVSAAPRSRVGGYG